MSAHDRPRRTVLDLTSRAPAALGAEVLVLAARAVSGPAGVRTDAAPASGPEDDAAPACASAPRAAVLTDGVDTAGIDVGALEGLLPTLGFTGGLDEVVRLPAAVLGGIAAGTVLVVGTGGELERAADPADDAAALGATRAGVLGRAAGRAVRALAGSADAVLALPAADESELTAVAEGAACAAHTWSGRPGAAAPPGRLVVAAPPADGALAAAVTARAATLADAVHLIRDLVDEPPNRLTPAVFAARAEALADAAGLEAEVLDEAALEEGGFGGIVGVGRGSTRPPRLVRVTWAPRRARSRVALVGKGITFDSGGLSLKPPASMPEMKSDMAGAATVLGVVLAAARQELAVRVDAWLALAENMPGGGAQRPSDIITMYDGTAVEITNTDAEGRLVLADALARAVQDGPDAVIDVATLTGAQIVALGERVGAVMGTPALRREVVEAAARAGEALWPMPLPAHLRAKLDSPFARLRNAAVGDRAGGMLVAGLFLREFVGRTPWAHLDVAGPAYNGRAPWGATPAGGTGAGAAALLELLRARAGA
ncbi:leucyl aminopeptidase [uncultured Actinomyces sp.]|uniref:leucyl aminopeptidase n=1 Tax=uncultured Actinomyces sp. TaxID=249061 RepID=UPI00288A0DAE|nr:leucyl aminopeptidase [uncultured Actinomyces sp.]